MLETLSNAPDVALEVVAVTDAERWTLSRPGDVGVLMAHLDVASRGAERSYFFYVTGWTYDEVRQRIERVRSSATSLLARRRREREKAVDRRGP